MCYTITGWENVGDNWIHAIQVRLGEGWDQYSIFPNDVPSCNLTGEWIWYPDYWIGCNTGGLYGPGFAYLTGDESCSGLWGNPGDNWGDGGGPCSQIPGFLDERRFCWLMEVLPCPSTENVNLDIEITVLGDGESGSWEIAACGQEIDEYVSLSTDCSSFDCVNWLAGVQGHNVSCEGYSDGSFTVYPVGTPTNSGYNVYVYNLFDELLYSAQNVSMPYTHPAVLDTGYYGILIEAEWAIGNDDYCNTGVASIINIQSSFEIFPELEAACGTEQAYLKARIWPPNPLTNYQCGIATASSGWL